MDYEPRRADFHPPDMAADYTIGSHWVKYTDDDHAVWRELYERQMSVLPGRACDEYLANLKVLNLRADRIPDIAEVSALLEKKTNWKLVIVPGLIPGQTFLEHLAKRQFPVTWWVRERAKMDYLQEPDIFHDIFGHVPMVAHPAFADYMEAWGHGALKAAKLGAEEYIARLYWFTVEFGLINTPKGLRIYGSGIVSSKKESIYCLESPIPNRLGFDVMRAMRTDYRIDDVQKTYFVIDSFEQLMRETKPDFTPYYEALKELPLIGAKEIMPDDHVIHEGVSVH